MARLTVSTPAGPVTRVVEGVSTDRTVTAGVDFATLHCATKTPGPHLWKVSAAARSEAAEFDAASGLYWSAVEVSAPEPGPIDVSVADFTLVLMAV